MTITDTSLDDWLRDASALVDPDAVASWIAAWIDSYRLDGPGQGAAGYALYGGATRDHFVFAIRADDGQIGAGTTIWLDSDMDGSSGHQIWGFAGGAEYNVEVAADGSARLHSGAAGEVFVADLPSVSTSDGKVLAVAVPKAKIGTPDKVRVFADVNNTAFIPNDYANIDLVVDGAAVAAPPAIYGAVTLDGSLADWDPAARLDTDATGAPGYALYGDVQGTGLVFAIAADAVEVGAGTTLWLDTDLNRATGHQIFGFTGGAEYNIEVAADGSAALYTGAAGQTYVADVDIGRSADGRTVEIGIDSALIGGATAARVFADVNNAVFIPNDYSNVDLIVQEEAPQTPDDPQLRVGIVYSETTAQNFYDLTSYTKLFMSAQHQAMQTGVPFDVLGEADLKDAAALSGYDALIFPTFSHVRAADLPQIESALATASQTHGVSLIAGGNFLTNDETGAALAGDSYARMKSLLGVTLDGFGQTQGLDLVARDGSNPVLSDYADGERVGSYTNTSYLTFTDVTGTGEVLFDQVVTDPLTGQGAEAAVLATTTGARNVHFATDAIIGNNNILGDAIDWVAQDDAPDVSLSMTRGTSLFYSRNDMDQSQEQWDVVLQDPGIYDVMLPILQDWYDTYGFVGSYYINIGANPPDQFTDWSVSRPYYEALMALESDIGAHGYSHPDNTNLLQGDTPELLELLKLVDPRNPGHVEPWELTPAQRDLLEASYRFQFETAKHEIESQLGIGVAGVAVPGAPERLDASRQIMPYYDYISGGYSSIGAGYLSAFGYLTPQDTGQVYLSPNMSFDFSLIGFRGLSPTEAEAVWAEEYAGITSHAEAPIIAFPWHDYGLTNWDLGDPVKLDYTLQMFESVVARAAADGTEFVTGAELAERIRSFSQTTLQLTADGDTITAQVGASDAGAFALDMGGEGTIASVAGWYAYDDDQVFLPRAGGTFEIALGGTPADVTHITALPMRAELVSVDGDGRNLDFAFDGRGEVTVALADQGTSTIRVTGADAADVSAGVATLGFDVVAAHSAAIDYVDTATVAGLDGDEFVFGSSGDDVFQASAGDDVFRGGGGADAYAIGFGTGRDVILDFDPAVDVLNVDDLGYADVADAFAAFEQKDDGMMLMWEIGGSLMLAGLTPEDLQAAATPVA